MRALVLYDVAQLEVRDVPLPTLDPYSVLVRVSWVGLCGTDFHIFAGHGNYNMDHKGQQIPLTEQPQILGHEIMGVVEEVGQNVTDIAVGDRVVLDQGLNCVSTRRAQHCEYCTTGNSHQCEFYREHGITGLPGGLAEYIVIPHVNAVRINSPLDSIRAVLTEPLACIVHASDLVAQSSARYSLNQDLERRVRTALICGAGPSGLLFIQYLRNVLGYDGILITSEPNPRRRKLASDFGATVVDPQAEDLIEAVREITKGHGIEYVIEAAGSGTFFTQIPGIARKQSTILLYAHGHQGVGLGALNYVQYLEPTLVAPIGASGGFDSDGRPLTYRRALNLLENGRIDVSSFITHRYKSLEELPRVFAGEHQGPEYVKGVFSNVH